jgi:hypothetical protein
MTTQTLLLDIFDYGAAPVTVTLHNPDTMVLADTADTVTQNGVNGCRYVAVFTRVSVLSAGVYAVGIEVNGIPGLLYCTLTGVDGETAIVRGERSSLATVEAKVDAFSVGLAGSSPVEPTGRIAQGGTVIAYIGDDFRVRSGTALPIPVKDPTVALKAKLEAIGVNNLFFGAAPKNGPVGAITGTISSITAAAGITTISVEISNCGGDLMPGSMSYQIQQSIPQSSEYDDFVELEGTLLLKPRTVAPRS